MSVPNENPETPGILVENVLVTIHEWYCEDCQHRHKLYGVSIAFSDGVEAYGYCEEKDVQAFINELVEAHGAEYPEAGTGAQK